MRKFSSQCSWRERSYGARKDGAAEAGNGYGGFLTLESTSPAEQRHYGTHAPLKRIPTRLPSGGSSGHSPRLRSRRAGGSCRGAWGGGEHRGLPSRQGGPQGNKRTEGPRSPGASGLTVHTWHWSHEAWPLRGEDGCEQLLLSSWESQRLFRPCTSLGLRPFPLRPGAWD